MAGLNLLFTIVFLAFATTHGKPFFEETPDWYYASSNISCVLIKMQMDFEVIYRNVTDSDKPTKPTYDQNLMTNKRAYAVIGGDCGTENQSITLGWKKVNTNVERDMTFQFSKVDAGSYKLTSIYTNFTIGDNVYKMETTKIGFVSIPLTSALQCLTLTTQEFEMTVTLVQNGNAKVKYVFDEAKVTLAKIRLQAFAKTKNGLFGADVTECYFGTSHNYQILVCALIAVIALIIVGVICFLKRSK